MAENSTHLLSGAHAHTQTFTRHTEDDRLEHVDDAHVDEEHDLHSLHSTKTEPEVHCGLLSHSERLAGAGHVTRRFSLRTPANMRFAAVTPANYR
jgi:hypothetical protein